MKILAVLLISLLPSFSATAGTLDRVANAESIPLPENEQLCKYSSAVSIRSEEKVLPSFRAYSWDADDSAWLPLRIEKIQQKPVSGAMNYVVHVKGFKNKKVGASESCPETKFRILW